MSVQLALYKARGNWLNRLLGKAAVRSAATDSAAQMAYDTALAQLSTMGK